LAEHFKRHGATMARQAKTMLRGALQLAVMANVLGSNPVRDVQPVRSKSQPKGAIDLAAEQLRHVGRTSEHRSSVSSTISWIRSRC
jgi:hypothetical protein